MDFIRPECGSIEVLGRDAQRDALEAHRSVGYLPSDPAMYGRMSARQYLDHITALRGGQKDSRYRDELVDRFRLDENQRIRTLSRGNRQKVGLIQALMGRPSVIVLDEPTTGLDPLMQDLVKDTLREYVRDGATVFFSSHLLAEVEEMCTRVAMLRSGRIVKVLDLAVERRIAPRSISVSFKEPPPADAFAGVPFVREARVDADRGQRWTFKLTGPIGPLLQCLARLEVDDLQTHELTLEEVFMSYYGDDLSEDQEQAEMPQ